MADKKISQLLAATLPLAGTELLPIVQSGTTDNITVNNLAAGNIKSNATTGVLQVTGPAAGATRVMTTPDANFTVARIDAANSFTADQTLSTGNLVIGTSGKGIDFSATSSGTGTMTSELLTDYEEGTWSPEVYYQNSTDQSTATNTAQYGWYTKVGRCVTLNYTLTFSQSTATASLVNDNIGIKNLPFRALNSTGYVSIGSCLITGMVTPVDSVMYLPSNGLTMTLQGITNTGNLSNEVGTGSHTFHGSITYFTG